MNPHIYFTTGEFARLCNVTKHTLFHYDEVGVFSPDIVTDKGYRYYSPAQYDVFIVITMLKELGMSLSEIKKYLDQRSTANFLELLEKQEKLIDKKIERFMYMKQMVKEKYRITQKACSIDEESITLQEEEEEHLVLSGTLNETDEKSMTLCMAELVNMCNSHHIYTQFTIGGIQKYSLLHRGIYDQYSCFYVKAIQRPINMPLYKKQKGRYAIAYHRGGFETLAKSYERLLNYGMKHNITFDEAFYEEIILDHLSVKGYGDYLIKLSVMCLQ